MRAITYEQGCTDIEEIITRFAFNVGMRDKKICGMVDLTLWSVSEGEGAELANAVITRYELHRPCNGSHQYFDVEGQETPYVIVLDPNAVVPDCDRIYPSEKSSNQLLKTLLKEFKLD